MKITRFVLALLLSALLVTVSPPRSIPTSFASAPKTTRATSGNTITVLLPPWGAAPKSMLAAFTKRTGITVNLETLAWDQIHDKLVTSVAAGVSPADVVELDSTWVGQFGRAGWFTPLNRYFSPAFLDDIHIIKLFTYQGNILGIPYGNDFRFLVYNAQYFHRAGISKPPQTLDELTADLVRIKARGIVRYPLGEPLTATEGAATPWYFLTKAYGGELFDKAWHPLFTTPGSPGYRAMTWLYDALKISKIIDPADIGLTDVQTFSAFTAGQSAAMFNGPGSLPVGNDPKQSKVAGEVRAALLPGLHGPAPTIGLPDALAIPRLSAHTAAAVQFIKWWFEPRNQIQFYNLLGDMPSATSVLTGLSRAHKLQDGDVIVQQSKTVEPIFPGGMPPWYPQFSGTVSTSINQMAKGQMTVAQAIKHIADVSATLAKH